MKSIFTIKTIAQLHEMIGYKKPYHPLITVIDYSQLPANPVAASMSITLDFYQVSLKTPAPKNMRYGRQYYDFAEGSMFFMAPGQVFSVSEISDETRYEGWGLFFHPDLIMRHPLAHKMKDYTFFSYAVSEALHVSETEKKTLQQLIFNIQREYENNLDTHSERLMAASIDLLLNYCQRFYGRQFITRKKVNTDVVSKFELLLAEYFEHAVTEAGLPTVEHFAELLNLSPDYLSDLLKKETGKGTQELIHLHLIEQAKLKLLNNNDSIREIAYSLGFEYPQYFTRLFKEKTGLTPKAFRQLN